MTKTCCSIDIFSAECVADPYTAYRQLRDEAPVCWTRGGFWLVTRHADVAALLTDKRCTHWGQEPAAHADLNADARGHANAKGNGNANANANGNGNGNADADADANVNADAKGGASHASLDAALSHALRRLAPASSAARGDLRRSVAATIAWQFDALANLTAQECITMLASLRARRTLDVMTDYAHPVTCRGVSRLMGVPDDQLDTITTLVSSLGGDVLSCQEPLRSFLLRLIAAKRAEPDDDMISAILETEPAAAGGEDERLLPLIVLLFHAGHQNMMNFIGNALLALMDAPDTLDAVRRSPALMARAVPELLRYDSPVQHIALVCREPFVLHDQAIEPGEPIFACVGSANRDPGAFVDPDRLDLTRASGHHLSFGTGAWRCMGAKLAERQGAIALSCLLARLPAFRLSPEHDAPVTWRTTPVVQRGPASLAIALAS